MPIPPVTRAFARERAGGPNRFCKGVAVLATLLTAENAFAGNILRRARGAGAMSPDAAAAQAAAAQAASAAQAQAVASRASVPLRRAMDAIRAAQNAQAIARAQARTLPSDVPDGLNDRGGLKVAQGGTWKGAAYPTQTESSGQTTVTVAQNEPKAILEWETFNVGRDTALHFDQTAGGDSVREWIALNRVVDPRAAPSKILGSIKAEGQVYVINGNGIIFGGSSQVNVSTLIASSLDFSTINEGTANAHFLNYGVLGYLNYPTFKGSGTGEVTVEEGAQITVGQFGQAAFFGHNVANRGFIEAPDGQVVLAANEEVWLVKDLEEGSHRYKPDDLRKGAAGLAENLGLTSAPRGNITMVGKNVRQNGILTATTGAQAVGSIYLGAEGQTTTFGSGSTTQVLPDDGRNSVLEEPSEEGGKKVLGAGSYVPSIIHVYGDRIIFQGGSMVYAPSGSVEVGSDQGHPDDGRIYLDAGARIDVSGLLGVEVPMERNTIEAQLRANELRDNPVLRDGLLRGRTVHFDARLGVTGVADLSGYYDLIERDVAELMVTGGSVKLVANEIITRAGSIIDLSGGSLRYRDGYVTSTYLVTATGRRVRIEDAKAGEPYVAIDGEFVANHARWGVAETFASALSRSRPQFERGYEQGASAGSLTLSTNGVPPNTSNQDAYKGPDPTPTGKYRILDGATVAEIVVGPYQRNLSASVPSGDLAATLTTAWRARPSGAKLILEKAGNVTIADLTAPQLDASFQADDLLKGEPYEHLLPASWFYGRFATLNIEGGVTVDGLFGNLTLATNYAAGGRLTIGSGVTVDLGDGGSFSFNGKRAEIDGTILAPGGTVTLSTLRRYGIDPITHSPFAGESRDDVPTLHLGKTGMIDVAGRWTDVGKSDASPQVRIQKGGSVSMTGANVELVAGSRVDVSGGGILDAAGAVRSGAAGSIAIDVSVDPTPSGGAQRFAGDGTLKLDGTLTGYALGKSGGSLSIVTPYEIFVGDGVPAGAGSHRWFCDSEFFTHGGFASYALVGERGVTVLANTHLMPSVETLSLADSATIASGTRLADALTVRRLPEGQRAPMTLSLSSIPARSIAFGATAPYAPDVKVETGAIIAMEPGSTVKLSSIGTLWVDGTIRGDGVRIELKADDKGPQTPLATARILLGPNATLQAPGWVKRTIEGGLERRSVEAGGTIVIANSASVGDVLIDRNSSLDVHGIQAVADLATGPQGHARYQEKTVDGAAGSISISASSGVMAGNLSMAPGGADGAGGALTISGGAGGFLVSQAFNLVEPVELGAQVATGPIRLSAEKLNASGADELVLTLPLVLDATNSNGSAIVFEGHVGLNTRRSIALISPFIGTTGADAQVALESGYVLIEGGSTGAGKSPAAFAANLDGKLTVEAGLIDLSRSIWLGCSTGKCDHGGFDTALFKSRGDIRLSGYGSDAMSSSAPGLFTRGAVEFQADQVYVTSRYAASSNLDREATDPGYLVLSEKAIRISRPDSNEALPAAPLSFGERLTLHAPVIEQGGVLRAPQGQIRLEGSESVTLLPGSLTSVALEGTTVPFGEALATNTFRGYDVAGAVPTKEVKIAAPTVAVQKDAVIDVSGGGDLLSWRFSPGNGGSQDITIPPVAPSKDPNRFAILPSLGTSPAPKARSVDLLHNYTTPKVGDTLWLQGVPGLESGYYTLLPAYYAQLPGAFLVTPTGGSFASAQQTVMRPDGSVIASGFRAVVGTSVRRAPGWARFQVMSRDVLDRHGEYPRYSFNEEARALAADAGVVVRTPFDAGSAVLGGDTTKSLVLEGKGRFGAGEGGLLGNLDLSARNIAVLGAGAQSSPGDGYLVLRVEELNNFGAGSVLVGGTRSASSGGTTLQVNATKVVVDTGAGEKWVGPEILLAATDTVEVRDRSSIEAAGDVSRDTNPLQLAATSGAFPGNGALLRVSTGERVVIGRTGATTDSGTLKVGDVNLIAAGSISFDATQSVDVGSEAKLSAKQFDLSSTLVNLGNVPVGTKGTTLATGFVEDLGKSSDFLVRAHDAIHIYGPLDLGGRDATTGVATLGKLTLDSRLVEGDGGTASITAGDLALRNTAAVEPSTSVKDLAGSLVLDVDTLVLGPGRIRLAGYRSLEGSARVIEGRGEGVFAVDGEINRLKTGQVRAASGADTTLDVTGAVSLDHLSVDPTTFDSLGGRFSLKGSSVALDTSVLLPAGWFEAIAKTGDLTLGANASVDVSGRAVDFEDVTRFAPGGAIVLTAMTGGVTVDPIAKLDVSASKNGGRAGLLEISAGGHASVRGQLEGTAAEGYLGGDFSLDAATADLAGLNARLRGFDASREIRLRAQDITLAADEVIKAHHVTLRSDNGAVRVEGTIDASGTSAHPSGGIIQLLGGGDVAIAGNLYARAGSAPSGGFDPASGSVEIVTTGGRVDVSKAAEIDVTGGSTEGGGSVVVRALRVGNDIAIDRLAGKVWAREVVVQGSQDYQASDVNAVLAQKMLGDASQWLAASKDVIGGRLGSADLPPLVVAPAMVVRSTGNLEISENLSLGEWKLGPGYLDFEAPGETHVRATVSDGFASAARTAALSRDRSFSLGFESGGDLVIHRDAMIRTGTGAITLRSGKDIKLEDATKAEEAPAVVYTAGRRADSEKGFTGTPRGDLPMGGGDIVLRAAQDIMAPLPRQTMSAWLFRDGATTWNGSRDNSTALQQASWSVVYDNFESGVGALGGGNVSVEAGRNIEQLQVAIPTTGHATTNIGAVPKASDLVVRGGGDLELRAFGDVKGGQFMLGRGHAELRAFGNVIPSSNHVDLRAALRNPDQKISRPLGALFALMDATANVTAASDVVVEAVYDPMLQGQVKEDLIGGGTAFLGYTERTLFAASSLAGDVTYANDPWASMDVSRRSGSKPAYEVTMKNGETGKTSLGWWFQHVPPTLALSSLSGSVVLSDPFKGSSSLNLASAPRGNLELLARRNVMLPITTVTLDDISPEYLRDGLYPFSITGDTANTDLIETDANHYLHGKDLLHAGDPEPVRLFALEGSVCAYRTASCERLSGTYQQATIQLPKPIAIYAGRDVRVGDYQVQNNGPTDFSSIHASRDIYNLAFQVLGDGGAYLEAGRDFVQNLNDNRQLTAPWGGMVQATGDLDPLSARINSALPRGKAASLYIVAGTGGGIDLDGFASNYLDLSNGQGVVRTYLDELAVYMEGLGYDKLSGAQLKSAFDALPRERRTAFLYSVYFTELKETGLDYNDRESPRFQSFKRGFDAISTLFPGDRTKVAGGDVILNAKPVETWADGSITILAPYGRVQVGAEGLSANDKGKGGVVTRRGGDIHVMADQNIELITSRAFTLQGGDITMWTSNGSITAGAGAKTTVAAPAPTYVMNADAVVTPDVFGVSTGAGIGVLDALNAGEKRRRSRLDLIAPKGEVNAGDAGIRAVGDLSIAAAVVVGIDNIQVSGATSGVPKVEVPNIGALTTASQMAKAAAQEGVGPAAASAAKNTLADLPSLITVEVIGYEVEKAGDGVEAKKDKGKVKKKN